MRRFALLSVLVACGDDGSTPADPDACTGAQLDVTPGNYVVGSAVRGASLDGLSVEVSRTGCSATGPITAVITGSSDFSIASNDCVELGPQETCTLALRFAPTSSSDTAAITGALVVTADPGGEATAMLSGTGLPVNVLVATADRIEFGRHPIGTTAPRQTVTISNPGPDPSGPLAVSFSTSSPPFAVHDDTCTGQSLAVNGTCTLAVDYSPVATVMLGTDGDSSDLRVRGNPGGIAAALLKGSGYTLGITPYQGAFANTAVGQTTAAQTFTFTNTTAAAMGPLDVTMTLGDAAHFGITADTCDGVTLAAQGTCIVSARFAPTSAGTKITQLEVKAPMTGTLRNEAGATLVGTAN